jgi:1,2-phenylacetyl-CoA epoxidase catalytic subunit
MELDTAVAEASGPVFAAFIEDRARSWYETNNLAAMKVLPGFADDPDRVRTWVLVRLKQGWLNEIDALHVAATWLIDAPVDIKRLLARQVQDEARHMDLLARRIRELGEDPEDWEPMAGYRRLFDRCLAHRGSLAARAALENFGAELISATWGNLPMIEVFDTVDPETAALYRNVIQKDEQFHIAIGRTIIRRYASTPEIRREVLAEQDWLFGLLGDLKAEYNQRLTTAGASASR